VDRYLTSCSGPETSGLKNLAVTWVEGGPRSGQEEHSHPAEEPAYVIVRGRGVMMMGSEALEVNEGTLVFIPPGTPHRIRAIGNEPLIYVSATSPPFEPGDRRR
jgi:mannose-6-phosphate isomerase-like protein (cupin superfamily)